MLETSTCFANFQNIVCLQKYSYKALSFIFLSNYIVIKNDNLTKLKTKNFFEIFFEVERTFISFTPSLLVLGTQQTFMSFRSGSVSVSAFTHGNSSPFFPSPNNSSSNFKEYSIVRDVVTIGVPMRLQQP